MLQKNIDRDTAKKPFPETKLPISLVIGVCIAVFMVHRPALSAKALSFDDNQYLIENILVQNPSWTSAKRFLLEILEPSTVKGYYQPLAMISLMLDYKLGGRPDDLLQFHCTSLLLHTANTALIIVLLYLLFGRSWPAAAAGLLFGVHPLTVEPIPWVGERKTLLATFFALWCLVLYVNYIRKNNKKFYWGCLVTYILALMSKPTTVALPIVMLLMDYWPLERINTKLKIKISGSGKIAKLVVEKLLFFAIGGISAIVTYISQSLTSVTALPTEYRPGIIPLILCHNTIFYLYKIIWPANLSSHYAFPAEWGLANPMMLAGVVGSGILAALLLISLRWTRAILTGWLIFFVAIFPTMGVIGYTNVIASDKFVYLPSVGLLMILAAFLNWLCAPGSSAKLTKQCAAAMAVVLILSGAEAAATRRYLVHWRDSVSLFRNMLKITPDDALVLDMLGSSLQWEGKPDEAVRYHQEALQAEPNSAYICYNLGNAFKSQGKLDEAISCYNRALQIDSNSAESHNNLGNVLLSQGKFDEALKHYLAAEKIKPDYPDIQYNLGNMFLTQGKFDEAVSHYRHALRLRPHDAEAYYKLGKALQSQGKYDEAIKQFYQSLQNRPGYAEAHKSIADLLSEMGKSDAAMEHYYKALETEPNNAAIHNNLGIILGAQNRLDEAIVHFQKVLEFSPGNAEAYNNLGIALGQAGRFDEAVDCYRKAIQLKPDWPLPMNGLAKILATHPDMNKRNAAEAIKLAERAAELTGYQNAIILDTLARAYASTGQFEKAASAAGKALGLVSAASDAELAERIRRQIETYKAKLKRPGE